MSEWVTDPRVIDTIVGLKGLRPGDEIKLKNGHELDISLVEDGHVVTVVGRHSLYRVGEPYDALSEDPRRTAIVVCCATTTSTRHGRLDYVLTRNQIAAWRRPT